MTRSQMRFVEQIDGKSEVVACVYRHYDGYPDGESGVVHDLAEFVKWETGDPEARSVYDLEYASANWIFWNKIQHLKFYKELHTEEDLLDHCKLGFGICPTTPEHIHGDVEYLYEFDGDILKVSKHYTKARNWDSVIWEFEGTLEEALNRYVEGASE